MSNKVYRARKARDGVFSVEILVVVIILGLSLHEELNLHGALATAVAIVVGMCLYALIVNVLWVFWIWTVLIMGGGSFLVFHLTKALFQDTGWAILASVVTAFALLGLHLLALEDSKRETIVLTHD